MIEFMILNQHDLQYGENQLQKTGDNSRPPA